MGSGHVVNCLKSRIYLFAVQCCHGTSSITLVHIKTFLPHAFMFYFYTYVHVCVFENLCLCGLAYIYMYVYVYIYICALLYYGLIQVSNVWLRYVN